MAFKSDGTKAARLPCIICKCVVVLQSIPISIFRGNTHLIFLYKVMRLKRTNGTGWLIIIDSVGCFNLWGGGEWGVIVYSVFM